MQFRNL